MYSWMPKAGHSRHSLSIFPRLSLRPCFSIVQSGDESASLIKMSARTIQNISTLKGRSVEDLLASEYRTS